MPDRCGYDLNLRAAEERCARWLATEYDYIHDDSPVEEVQAFSDLPRDDDGRWQCPRVPREGGRCVLHDQDASDADVRAAVLATLRGEYSAEEFGVDAPDGDYRTLASRMLGVELDTLDLHGCRHAAPDVPALDLRCADIDTLRLGDATIDAPIRLDGATLGSLSGIGADIGGSLGARFVTVEGDLTLDRATVDGRVDCRFSRIGGDASVAHTTAGSRFDFGFSHVDGVVDAAGGDCGGRFTLKEAVVDAVSAAGVAVSGADPESDIPGLQFRGLTTRRSVDLTGADCVGQLIGYRMAIGGDFDASGATITQGVSLATRTGTRLGEATIDGTLSFSEARIDDETKLRGRDRRDATLAVGGRLDLSEGTFEQLQALPNMTHDRLSVVDCRGATIHEGVLAGHDSGETVLYDLEEAELGDVQIRPGGASAPAMLWLDRTAFAGFTFVDEARRGFERADWTLIDESPERRETVAFARAFGDATEYARDFAALCVARPRLREWLAETDPPYDAESLASAVFDGAGERAFERVAKNGPENPEQLGVAPFRRERYRVGVATLLARAVRSDDEDDRRLAATVADGAGDALAALDGRVDGDTDPESVDTATLRDALADALADPDAASRSLEQQELTYIEARKGADDVGDSSTAGNLFVNERRIRREIHRREGDWVDFYANRTFDWVAGYGERPRRALRSSLLLVGGFAAVYWVLWYLLPGFSSPTYGGVDGALLLSSASFTAFVLGGTTVEAVPIRLLANVEALLGAFMIALFVFTLTRSLHR
ncbi:hypothetical protein [Halolamina litorea]|uniref:Pentapeptide repeat-containing protein n=1 Tax=Halolamina litorea TaxID=1515593 RepID=A0ABD6BPP5_9EURY